MGVGGQCHVLAALHPEMTQFPLCRRLGGPQGWSGWAREISKLSNIGMPFYKYVNNLNTYETI